MRRILPVVSAAAALAWTAPAPAAQPVDLLIRHASVIDVHTGKIAREQVVAIRGGDIVSVGPDSGAKAFAARQTVDATGRFVMPGLWDMHVHFGGGPELIQENRDLLPLYLAHGITSIRDCAGDLADDVLAWRDEIRSGALPGPTLYTSGPKLEGYKPIWKGVLEVGTEAEVDAALDRLQGLKVDFVKITDNTLKPELFLYAVRQATKRGLRTSAHIPAAVTVEQASEAGLTSIEHMSYALRPGSPQEAALAADVAAGRIAPAEATARTLAAFDPAVARAAYRGFAAKGTMITPTLNGSKATAYLDQDDHRHDAYLAYIGPGLKKTYEWRVERAAKDDAAAIARRHRTYEKAADLLPLLRDAGMTIIAGTDAGFLNSFNYPGIGLHDEMAIFVAHGLTPLQTLQAATLAGPKYFGVSDRYGAVAAGKAADILILDRNPVQDISATRTVRGVVLRGRYFDRAALDAMLAEARAKVARAEGRS
ncbi:MAG: amidohydrolase family protein [Phenylobacterium sp.]|uniref:amidohydrolase family protein n=1 Tax=Phenylobacterium sp. TaxID=1871053 RepID=UPI001A3B0674|nr:amidohydrolase family protein [Phenylobacterium sp.]MBL8554564.1 amidohydrolase family protein [Phenylobacterium sp.]